METWQQSVRIERHRAGDVDIWLFVDEGLANAPLPWERPLVFVQHGLHSRKERHLDLCLRLAAQGLRVAALDTRGHGERATPAMTRRLSDSRTSEFYVAFGEAVHGTVRDLADVATYFNAPRYAIVGRSMGGFIALQTALADPRVCSVVCISGVIDVSAANNPRLPAAVRLMAQSSDLVAQAHCFFPRPVLLLHGESDNEVPVSGATRLYNALAPHYISQPYRLHKEIYPSVGHELIHHMTEAAIAWTAHYARE